MCVEVGEVYACQGIGVEVRRPFCQYLCHTLMSYVDSWDLKADKSMSVFMCFSGCFGADKSSWLLKINHSKNGSQSLALALQNHLILTWSQSTAVLHVGFAHFDTLSPYHLVTWM